MSLIEKAAERLDGLRLGHARQDGVATSKCDDFGSTGTKNEATRNEGTLTPTGGESGKPTSRQVSLDLGRLATDGFVVPDAPGTLTAEEFRVLKRPLLANVAGSAAPIRNANLIMVTSSVPGEGKTFTAINLAMSIAMELDRTVLLVDADVARPSLLRILNLPEQKGLLNLLQDKSLKLSDVLLRTNVSKLTVLPAGTRDAQATELLASDLMGRLLSEIARRYSDRVVIFDSPPLLSTTEARVLATRMGQIVFVVRAEETPQNAVKEALATIEACPVKLMVLNQARQIANGAHGYEYGYGD